MRHYSDLDLLSDFDGTFPWRTRYFIHRSGIRQAYYDEGARDAELTFVCVHGNPTWSYLYRRFIARLSCKYRIIAIDHVGFGRSDIPRDPAYYSLATHITNLRFVLEHLALRRVVLIAHDWGGPIGLGWAVNNSPKLAGIVVLDSAAFVQDPPITLPWRYKFLVLGPLGRRRVVNDNSLVEQFLARNGTLPFEARNAYRAPFPTPDTRVAIARFSQMIPETTNWTHESWGLLASIENTLTRVRHVPALLCCGMRKGAFDIRVRDRWTTVFASVDGPHLFSNPGHALQEGAADLVLDHIDRWASQTVQTKARGLDLAR